MKRDIILGSIFGLMFFAIFVFIVSKFSPGSYADAIDYEVNMFSHDLIQRFTKLKRENPDLNVLSRNQQGELYNYDGKSGYFYGFYFNLSVDNWENIILHTVIDVRDSYPANLKLVGISYDSDLRGFTRFKDLSKKEREKIKALFKKQVIDRI